MSWKWFALSALAVFCYICIEQSTAARFEKTVQNVTYKVSSAVYMNITKPVHHNWKKNETVRIVIGLLDDEVPKTTENFRKLCTAETGKGYKGSSIFNVMATFMIKGGDYEFNNGTGGKSIYNDNKENPGYFELEKTRVEHSDAGWVTMETHTVHDKFYAGSQFIITVEPMHHLDHLHCAFGKVLVGQKYIEEIAFIPASDSHVPEHPAVINDCGIWKLEKPVDVQSTITTYAHSEL